MGKKEVEEEENARSEKDDSPPIGRVCGTTQIDGKNVDDKNNMKAIRMTGGEEAKKEEKQEENTSMARSQWITKKSKSEK